MEATTEQLTEAFRILNGEIPAPPFWEITVSSLPTNITPKITFRKAMKIASPPRSRFFFGSPCRFIARCDFICHVLIPSLLRKGDTSQLSTWDHCRLFVSQRLNMTSPRWRWLAQSERSMA